MALKRSKYTVKCSFIYKLQDKEKQNLKNLSPGVDLKEVLKIPYPALNLLLNISEELHLFFFFF